MLGERPHVPQAQPARRTQSGAHPDTSRGFLQAAKLPPFSWGRALALLGRGASTPRLPSLLSGPLGASCRGGPSWFCGQAPGPSCPHSECSTRCPTAHRAAHALLQHWGGCKRELPGPSTHGVPGLVPHDMASPGTWPRAQGREGHSPSATTPLLRPSQSPSCLGRGHCPKAGDTPWPALALLHPMSPGPWGPAVSSHHC